MIETNKDWCFSTLLSSVNQCDLCPRMCNRKKVLSDKNGNLNTKVLFIAEAPGRLGAERTGIPLYGDKSGDNFEMLLGNIGWERKDVFITNAVLCNPQDAEGNNATPQKDEILNCNYYLQMLISIIEPAVIVTLGTKALDALNYISPHNITLKGGVATAHKWNGTTVFPLYHTGARAVVHRSLPSQRADFIALSHFVDPLTGLKTRRTEKSKKKPSKRTDGALLDLIMLVLDSFKQLSYFKLTKLLYLIDLYHYEQFGYTITNGAYLRMQEGPWLPSLKDTVDEYSGDLFVERFIRKKPYITILQDNYAFEIITPAQVKFAEELCTKYRDYSDGDIKRAAYLTKPMKFILTAERKGEKMSNVVILYKDKTIADKTR